MLSVSPFAPQLRFADRQSHLESEHQPEAAHRHDGPGKKRSPLLVSTLEQHDRDRKRDLLTAALRDKARIPIHIETSGVDILSGEPDWITLSPKRHRPPRPEVLQACHELKVVVHEPADLLFAEVVAAQATQANWLLQPGWDCQEGLQLAVSKVQQDQRWRLSMQSHKWLGVR